jgi:predicted membrane channel-forming protein YqfA (hemolysin III family)
MTGLVELFALLAIVALLAWRVGSFALRIGGVLLVLLGLVGVAFAHEIASGLAAIVLGGAAWLAGHWLYAYRHHEYRSPLAERAFLHLLPRRVDPTRGWGESTSTAAPAPTLRVEVAVQTSKPAPDQAHASRPRRRRPDHG